jgi:hypothetical protein
MKSFRTRIALLIPLTVIASGCSQEDSALTVETTNQPIVTKDAEADTSTPDNDSQTGVGTILGTVRINDFTTYAITDMRRCEPLNDGTIERELELQGLGEHDGQRIQIDVYKQMIAGQAAHEVSWSGPEGVFGSSDIASLTWGPDETNILGSSELVDSLGQTEKILIGFDLQVPTETIPCR